MNNGVRWSKIKNWTLRALFWQRWECSSASRWKRKVPLRHSLLSRGWSCSNYQPPPIQELSQQLLPQRFLAHFTATSNRVLAIQTDMHIVNTYVIYSTAGTLLKTRLNLVKDNRWEHIRLSVQDAWYFSSSRKRCAVHQESTPDYRYETESISVQNDSDMVVH